MLTHYHQVATDKDKDKDGLYMYYIFFLFSITHVFTYITLRPIYIQLSTRFPTTFSTTSANRIL